MDHGDLNAFDNKLAESLSERPAYYLPLFEEAAQEVIAMSLVPRPHKLEDMQSIQCQIVNFQRNEIKIRDLKSENIAKMVTIPGIIISSTKVKKRERKTTKNNLLCVRIFNLLCFLVFVVCHFLFFIFYFYFFRHLAKQQKSH